MELRNEFRAGVPAETAWQILTDVERIAPCLPGAQLFEIEGEEYRGVVKVKVGPITAQYKGNATVIEQDDADRRVVLRAAGRDVGAGHANATITAVVSPDGEASRISVLIDLDMTGKASQYGRGVLSEVCSRLLREFVACVERTLVSAGVGASPFTPVGGIVGSLTDRPAGGGKGAEEAGDGADSIGTDDEQAAARAADEQAAARAADEAGSDGADSIGTDDEPSAARAADEQAAARAAEAVSTFEVLAAAEDALTGGPGSELIPPPAPVAPPATTAAAQGPSALTTAAPASNGSAPSAGATAPPAPPEPAVSSRSAAPTAPVEPGSEGGADTAAAPAARRVEGPEVEPVDVLPIVARSVIKRVLPVLGAIAFIVVVRRWRRRRR